MGSGIYSITNKISKKRYIGQSKNIQTRMKEHLRNLRNQKSHNSILQKAWNKYGESNFIFETVEQCLLGALVEKEQFWMDYYHSHCSKNGYNQSPSAKSNLGWKMPEEARQKISMALKGRPGHSCSEELKEHYRNLYTGRELSKEQRQNISLGIIKYYENGGEASCGMLGKHHSEDSKKKIKFSQIGKPKQHSEIGKQNIIESNRKRKGQEKTLEIRKKISESNKGQTRTDETKQKLSIAWDYDKHFTPSSRKKLSESAKEVWAKRKAEGWSGWKRRDTYV